MTSQTTPPAGRNSVFGTRDEPRRAIWLLLGPCVLYLVAFTIYPLFYSLRLSLTDLTAATGTGKFVGLENYRALLVDPQFWNAAKNSAIMVAVSVAIQVVLGVALAMFFNLQLGDRGSSAASCSCRC